MPKKTKSRNAKPASTANTSAPKSRPKRRAKSRKTRIPADLVESVCSITDPFCPAAYGAKAFDGSTTRSVPWTIRYRLNLPAATSDGVASAVILPYANVNYELPSVTAGSLVATCNVALNNSAGTVPSTTSLYRLVSQGIIVRPIGSVLNRSGILHVRLFGGTVASLATFTVNTFNAAESFDYPINADMEPIYITNRKVNDPLAMTFVAPSVSSPDLVFANQVPNGWSYVAISTTTAQGLVSSFDIEVVNHFELIFADSEPMQQMATVTKPPNPVVTNAIAIVQDRAGAAIQTTAEKAAKTFFNRAIEGVASAVGSYFGGPMGGAAAGLLTNVSSRGTVVD